MTIQLLLGLSAWLSSAMGNREQSVATPVWEQTTPVTKVSRAEQIALDHSIAVAMAGDSEEDEGASTSPAAASPFHNGARQRSDLRGGLPWSAKTPPRYWRAPRETCFIADSASASASVCPSVCHHHEPSHNGIVPSAFSWEYVIFIILLFTLYTYRFIAETELYLF